MFERFTERGRRVMTLANELAQRFGHKCIGTEHILLGLIKQGGGKGGDILGECGVDTFEMIGEMEQLLEFRGGADATSDVAVTPASGAVNVVQYAAEEARSLKHDHIGTEHILLGLLRESDGVAAQVLANLGVTLDAVRSMIE